MHWQVLGSGSGGNSLVVRAGESRLLIDCGLPGPDLVKRLELAGLPSLAVRPLDHVVLTHGHLDHARSAGMVGRATRAAVHAPENMLRNRSMRGARERRAVRAQEPLDLSAAPGRPARVENLEILPVEVPHDAEPTFAYRVRHGERVAVHITDMGRPADDATAALRGAHRRCLS